jgi:hypothetical protein
VLFARIKTEERPPEPPAPPVSTLPRRGLPLWAKILIASVLVPLGTLAALIVLVLGICMSGRH